MRGRDYYRIEDAAGQARRDATSGDPEARQLLSEKRYWWEEDADGKAVLMEETAKGPRIFAVEVGSKLVLGERESGSEMALGRSASCEGLVFERKCYVPSEIYRFDELPSVTRRDAKNQREEFEVHFGKEPEFVDFRFQVMPHEALLGVLARQFGEDLKPLMLSPQVRRLARSIGEEGLKYPAVGSEGWKRALATASVGKDLPYFEPIPPLEFVPEPSFPSLEGRRRKEKDPEFRQHREGYWRMLQRIHAGIPGFEGTGYVKDYQFTGGNAGVRTAWTVYPASTLGMLDAIPVAGFYSFGIAWPKVMRAIGLTGDSSKIINELEEEFGIAPHTDLARGTVANPGRKAPGGQT